MVSITLPITNRYFSLTAPTELPVRCLTHRDARTRKPFRFSKAHTTPSLHMAYPDGARRNTIIDVYTKTPEKANKVRSRSPVIDVVESPPTPKTWTKLESVAEETPLPNSLKQRNESPWGRYDESHELDRGGPVTVTVAIQREPGTALVNIRKFAKPEMEAALYRYQNVQHGSFVTALETFITDDHLYVVLEDMPISLEHIVQLPRYPTDVQLAAMLAPVSGPRNLDPQRELILVDSCWLELSKERGP